MINPTTTYRIQFHKDFNFKKFREIIPYLQQLGITTIYASPIFKAVPGSVHGYDILDPNIINPEIGTLEELEEISKELQSGGMLWIQDIVPNHMAFHHMNPWLMDVLEKGTQSEYADYFDISWEDGSKLMVPFLGGTLDEVIEKKELQLVFENEKYFLKYHDSLYPVNYDSLASARNGRRAAEAGMEAIKLVDEVNTEPARLKTIADAQAYRLCHWQETDRHINYRRFFTINGLICLNIHHKKVLDHHHTLVLDLVKNKTFNGLRIDHIDGLYDPANYLNQLKTLAGEEIYIVVEKILERKEQLPSSWPAEGTTGYDFLAIVNNVFSNREAGEKFSDYYRSISHTTSIEQQVHEKKAYILYQHMAGELDNLYKFFVELQLTETQPEQQAVKTAIAEFLIHCPVYRYYGTCFPLDSPEATAVQDIFTVIRKNKPSSALDLLEDVLLKKPLNASADYRQKVARFYQRCMQFTGPLMAKGVEDTLMYTYNRFIVHNEVGDAPGAFGIPANEFHRQMQVRQQRWNLSMNGTSTHDTKKGEDVRARLNVLSDLPDEWLHLVKEWAKLNTGFKKDGAPDANDEYLIYQALVGTYPMADTNHEEFKERLNEYLQKALREAKQHSNWTSPDEKYEGAAKSFATALLDEGSPFRKSFTSFLGRITDHGIINSLSQVLLKFTCPGIPDVYQGAESWDFSFVDPDNRRPVDYEAREQLLRQSIEKERQTLLQELWDQRHTGQIKIWLVRLLANLRKEDPEFWTKAEYLPLKTRGKHKDKILVFARAERQKLYIIALPLHTAALCTSGENDFFRIDWSDTEIELPANIEELENTITGEAIAVNKRISVNHFFASFPAAIMKGKRKASERGAGILLHISSLPASFAVGDLGPSAIAFADFLHRSRQQYWQLLPVNPTEGGQGYSPYSAISSRAGYPLLISPEWLVKEGLLDAADMERKEAESRINFAEAENLKYRLLDKAFENFKKSSGPSDVSLLRETEFKNFCEEEQDWLHDFALYAVLKKKFGKAWYDWPPEYKKRDAAALEALSAEEEVEKNKWLQFIFFTQWKELKTHCNKKDIKLIGDLPFYVSYDSADVWSHREIFAVDESGERTGMAGVPPDAFSEDGQLWGMPVFRWDVLKEQDYKWWKERIRKNLQLFDLVRIDHFRAFEKYWEVPPGEDTARNGVWKEGPGREFFQSVKKEFPGLPFIAEDLGDVDDKVFDLRDEFSLPGMKVLQFAFGEDLPESPHIVHHHSKNFVVYTGTHDNNTTKGWFRAEADEGTRHRIQNYLWREIHEGNINEAMIKMAYASVAKIAIIPMQDILSLDESARMNTPASAEGNWKWKLLANQLNTEVEHMLEHLTYTYSR